jgi:hypothetical protein
LRGNIITSSKEIDLPQKEKNFERELRRQDQTTITSDENDRWVIHFVAFFNRPLPKNTAGVVVLDARGEPAAVADVQVKKGQTNLASQIVVPSTLTPRKQHVLQVYYAKSGKPMVLARKPIILY